MGNRRAAIRLFWELVEDYRDWAEAQLRSNPCQGQAADALGQAVVQTTIYLRKAAAHAGNEDWEATAQACREMAGAAMNLASCEEFGHARELIWDLAMAAYIAAGNRGELYPEVRREVLRDLLASFGSKANEFVPGY